MHQYVSLFYFGNFHLGQTCVANAVQVAMAKNGATERADVLLWRWTGQVFSAGQRSAPEACSWCKVVSFRVTHGYLWSSMAIPYTSLKSKMICVAMTTLVILGKKVWGSWFMRGFVSRWFQKGWWLEASRTWIRMFRSLKIVIYLKTFWILR